MGEMTRQREAQIQDGLVGSAGDVDAELDHVVTQHNESEGRLVTAESDIDDLETETADLPTIRTDITTLQTDLDAAEVDIAELQVAGLGGITVVNTSYQHGAFTESQIHINSPGVQVTLGSIVGQGLVAGQRWLVVARFTGLPSWINSNQSAPDNDSRVQLRDGDMAMIVVVDDVNYAGTLRYAITLIPASHQFNEYESITVDTVYTKANMPRTIHINNTGTSVTLPAISDDMIGRDVMIVNHVGGSNDLICNVADGITGKGDDLTTVAIDGNTAVTLRVSPDMGGGSYNWCLI